LKYFSTNPGRGTADGRSFGMSGIVDIMETAIDMSRRLMGFVTLEGGSMRTLYDSTKADATP